MTRQRTPPSHTVRPKGQKRKKVSADARRLMHHLLKVRKLSLRAAARQLGLPNHGQLDQMQKGLISETAAMKAAVLRARERGRRAFLNVKEPSPIALDVSKVTVLIKEHRALLEELEKLIDD